MLWFWGGSCDGEGTQQPTNVFLYFLHLSGALGPWLSSSEPWLEHRHPNILPRGPLGLTAVPFLCLPGHLCL